MNDAQKVTTKTCGDFLCILRANAAYFNILEYINLVNE